jgi:hypothetical protein
MKPSNAYFVAVFCYKSDHSSRKAYSNKKALKNSVFRALYLVLCDFLKILLKNYFGYFAYRLRYALRVKTTLCL